MLSEKLNVCQVSLAGNIPIIKRNYKNFCKFYDKPIFFIICPNKEFKIFKRNFNSNQIRIIKENSIISFGDFKKIFLNLSKKINYKNEFKKRLNWYYQQILKISFVCDYVKFNKKNMIIWDADTIILNKINFFNMPYSIRYGSVFEFHRSYYITNKNIFGFLPNYFVSSLLQFMALTPKENFFLIKNLKKFMRKKNSKTSHWISKIVFKAIFKKHKIYNGSLFSEYELMGMSKLIYKNRQQKILIYLRNNLNGQLTNLQMRICKFLKFAHITYEHTYVNKRSRGMLKRNQTWFSFLKILLNRISNFLYRSAKHKLFYYLSLMEKNKKINLIYR